jgi:hypothetical protein
MTEPAQCVRRNTKDFSGRALGDQAVQTPMRFIHPYLLRIKSGVQE